MQQIIYIEAFSITLQNAHGLGKYFLHKISLDDGWKLSHRKKKYLPSPRERGKFEQC